MTSKQVRAQYTQEFKQEAVRQVRAGQAQSVVAKVLGILKTSLGNWVRLAAKGALGGAGSADKQAKVSPEQMEIARLRAKNARLRMDRDIAKKPQRTSRRTRCEVRLDGPNEAPLPGEPVLRGVASQCQGVLQLAALPARRWWLRRPALQRRSPAGAHPRHPRRGQGRIRLASDAQGIAGPGHPGGQGPGAQTHAAA